MRFELRIVCRDRFLAPRIGAFLRVDRMLRYAARKSCALTSLMRHFLLGSVAPTPLPRRVQTRSAQGALVTCAGAAHPLPATDPRTLPGTVDVAVVTLPADAYLHRAAPAVVEPVGRLRQRPQDPLPKALDSTGARQA
jgi:hypothetical protein